MATAAELRRRVYDYLYSSYPVERPGEDTLNGAITNVATSVTVDNGDQWETNDVLEVLETGERMHVVSQAANVLTVIRGIGAVAGTAAADDGRVFKSPRFSYDQVNDAITATIASLESWGVHVWGVGSVTLAAQQETYPLSETDIMEQYGILSVYYEETNTLNQISLPFHQHSQINTAAVTGVQDQLLRLWATGAVAAGESVYFTYAKIPADATELLVRQEETVVLGAVALLLGKTLAPRTQDPGAYTDRTVQPGQGARDGRWFQGEFFVRARAEAAQLAVERQRLPGTARNKRARRWRP